MICQTPGCGKPIERVPDGFRSPTGYLHTGSNRVCCFDVYKPEYATPPPNDGYEPSGLDEFARTTQPERNHPHG